MGLARSSERQLIFYISLLIILGLGILKYFFPDLEPKMFQQGLIISAIFFALHIFLILLNYKCDSYLLPISATLTGIGFVFLYRLKPAFAERQFWWIIVGAITFIVAILTTRNYRKLGQFKYLYMLVGLLALVITVIFGTRVGGSTNWITIGQFRFQPAEVVKLFLVLFLASYLVDKKELLVKPKLEHLGPLLIMWGMSVLFLVSQKDLGTALLFFGTFLAMLYAATGKWTYTTIGSLLFSAGATVAYFLFGHVRVRFDIWLDPWTDINGKGYQIAQSLFAIGSGGLFGSGLGSGKASVIPAVHTDFIFAAITEELGLIGGIGIIILYILLIYRGFRIALKAKNDFGMMLATGLTCLLAIQTFIILGGVIKFIPLTGITLPFISYGGSSLLANFFLIGLLCSISHREEEEYEK